VIVLLGSVRGSACVWLSGRAGASMYTVLAATPPYSLRTSLVRKAQAVLIPHGECVCMRVSVSVHACAVTWESWACRRGSSFTRCSTPEPRRRARSASPIVTFTSTCGSRSVGEGVRLCVWGGTSTACVRQTAHPQLPALAHAPTHTRALTPTASVKWTHISTTQAP
jgi:hypothetical protein